MRTLRDHWPDEGWKQFVLLASLGAFFLGVWGFLQLAVRAPGGTYLELEHRLLLAFRQPDDVAQGIGPWWAPGMARDITALGSAFVLTLVTAAAVGFLALRRRVRTALLILAATLGGYILSSELKEWFGRGRPEVVPHLSEELSMSFPSGHAMVGAAFYLTLGVLLAQTVARRREKLYFVIIALAITGLIGVSRVYLGVHYPTDVVAGWAAGSAWALFCWGIACWLQWRGSLRTSAQAAEVQAATTPHPLNSQTDSATTP